jgi:hypothetical protein
LQIARIGRRGLSRQLQRASRIAKLSLDLAGKRQDLRIARGWPAWTRPAWTRAALAAAACVAVCIPDWRRIEYPIGVRLDMARYPVRACDFMAAHGVRGRGFNDLQGGYQAWRFWPERERLPFMDIHPEDTPPDVRLDYLRALNSPTAFDRFDLRWRFDWALLSRRYGDRPGILGIFDNDPRWALVFVDDVAAVYVKRGGELAPISDRYAYHILRGSRMESPEIIAAAAADTAFANALALELERQARESPVNFYGRSMLRAIGR